MSWQHHAWRGIVAATALGVGITVARLDWSRVAPSLPFIALSLGRSWVLALLSMTLGAAAAIPLALLRLYGGAVSRSIATAVIELVRATPELMVIFWVYFTLPLLTGRGVTAWTAALVSLAAIAASSLAEIIRGGLMSVP